MTQIFHPQTLELILNYKKEEKETDLVNLILLILDNSYFVDIDYFTNTILSLDSEKSDQIKNFIKNNFSLKNNVILCKNLSNFKYKEIIKEGRKYAPGFVGDRQVTNFLDTFNKKSTKKNSIVKVGDVLNSIGSDSMNVSDSKFYYNPLRIMEVQRINTTKSNLSFEPLILKDKTFVFDKNNIVRQTQRMRNDLFKPVQLQFIKHYDQRRPPIYRKREFILVRKCSYEVFPEILNYDSDSSEEWEEIEESDVIISESETVTEGDEDWIEPDSEQMESTRFTKKPYFIFDQVKVVNYFN